MKARGKGAPKKKRTAEGGVPCLLNSRNRDQIVVANLRCDRVEEVPEEEGWWWRWWHFCAEASGQVLMHLTVSWCTKRCSRRQGARAGVSRFGQLVLRTLRRCIAGFDLKSIPVAHRLLARPRSKGGLDICRSPILPLRRSDDSNCHGKRSPTPKSPLLTDGNVFLQRRSSLLYGHL